jgi:REP element-mobilizing transposase RayT
MPDDHDTYRTHHASRRLRGVDYTQSAAYFITICAHERRCLFGEIRGGEMHVNAAGRIVGEEWRRTDDLRDEIALDAFVVMPNHVHGIVVLKPPGADAPTDPRGYDLRRAGSGTPPRDGNPSRSDMARHVATSSKGEFANPKAGSLGTIIGAFKSASTRRINRRRDTPSESVWQRNYYDRILRDEGEWRGARRYIERNPARWSDDRNHPTKL